MVRVVVGIKVEVVVEVEVVVGKELISYAIGKKLREALEGKK